jgi:hypothetical protein
MEQNPYESPKQPSDQEPGRRLTPGLLAIVLSVVGVIPAGCICGGVTCFSAQLAGGAVIQTSQNPSLQGLGSAIGILLGLGVMVLVWIVCDKWKRNP